MSDKPLGDACRRKYYRLRYPSSERPTFERMESAFEVVELSERGFRFTGPGHDRFAHGERIAGTLVLPSRNVEVFGTVSRIHGEEVVVVAVVGVSFACLLDEQRRIATRFLT